MNNEIKITLITAISLVIIIPLIMLTWSISRRPADDIVKIERTRTENRIICNKAGGITIEDEMNRESCIFPKQ